MPNRLPIACPFHDRRRHHFSAVGLRSGQPRGYVLLVVIASLVLVTTVLGTLARQSLRQGLAGADAQRSLQQRWGAETLREAVFAQAGNVFDLREELAMAVSPDRPPVPVIRDRVQFGGIAYHLWLADEDAKLNLNTLYHVAGPERVSQALSEIAPPNMRAAIQLIPQLKPLELSRESSRLSKTDPDTDAKVQSPPAFRSWGEVFDLSRLSTSSDLVASLANGTVQLSCWGNGQLNIRRASDAAVKAIAATVLEAGGATRFLRQYRQHTELGLPTLLQTEVERPEDRERLSELLAESSTNFSLWLEASTAGVPSRRQWTVMQRDAEGVTAVHQFSF